MMRLTVIVLLLISCQHGQGINTANHGNIDKASKVIDVKANDIEKQFPEAKPHTDKIKEQTPIIRTANDEQQQIIQELTIKNKEQAEYIEELKKKEDSIFKLIFCGGLAVLGGLGFYFGSNGGGTMRTVLGASLLASVPCAYRYYDFIADYLVPIFAVVGVVVYTLVQRDKDIERVENIKRMK